jgi:hypothetical protein
MQVVVIDHFPDGDPDEQQERQQRQDRLSRLVESLRATWGAIRRRWRRRGAPPVPPP